MSTEPRRVLSTASVPAVWPNAPEVLSFSTLKEIETCPRRWALGHGSYPEVWKGIGYPPALNAAALKGTVVHLAVETITRALAAEVDPSQGAAGVIRVLRDLGGFSDVVSQCIGRALLGFEGNPRAVSRIDEVRRSLEAHLPMLRTKVQCLISRVHLEPRSASSHRNVVKEVMPKVRRGALPNGSYSEVQLNARELNWRGVVDLITLSEKHCEIRDFKTGDARDDHSLQIRVYAVLWWKDAELNPVARPAESLVLSYGSEDVRVPALGLDELQSVESWIKARSSSALKRLETAPPEATPTLENCAFCGVRHLCDDYWQWAKSRTANSKSAQFADVQIQLLERKGVTGWSAVVESCAELAVGSRIFFQSKEADLVFRQGQRLRILSANIIVASEDGADEQPSCPVVCMTVASEVYSVAP